MDETLGILSGLCTFTFASRLCQMVISTHLCTICSDKTIECLFTRNNISYVCTREILFGGFLHNVTGVISFSMFKPGVLKLMGY